MDYKLIWRLIYGSFCILGNWNLCFFGEHSYTSKTHTHTHTHTQLINMKYSRSAKVQSTWSQRSDAALLENTLEVIVDTVTDVQQSHQIMIRV